MPDLSLRDILYQSPLKAKIPRDNFTDIENYVNDLSHQVDAIVAPSTKVQINTCESLTGWAAGGDASLSLNSTTFREGTKSLQFDKTGATVQLFEATLTISATVFDNRKITVWVYIADNTTRDNLNSVTSHYDIGSGVNYKRISVGATGQAFATGWNEFILDFDNPASIVGSVPNGFQCTFIDLEFNANASGDTFVNKILLDDIYYGPNDATETQNARDYHTTVRNRLRSGFLGIGNYLVTGGVVSEQGTPDMTVHVTAGEAIVNGVGCKWDAMDSGTITAPGSNSRWDTVVINSDNTISLVSGTAAASPVLPSLAATQKKLAHILITSATTSITDAIITDARREPAPGAYFGINEPIGTIKAWHKSFTNVPALTEEYKECDGTTIDDPESPMYGQTIPDLNGGNRFLKGASTSGTLEASANKSHTHTATDAGHEHTLVGFFDPGGANTDTVDTPSGGWTNIIIPNAGYDGTAAQTANPVGWAQTNYADISVGSDGATDAIPKNMTVVWIMRIK